MIVRDAFGNPAGVDDAGSEAAIRDFTEGFCACQLRVLNLLPAARHDGAPLVQAYAAALQMFGESPDGPRNARPHLDRARARLNDTDPRERAVVGMIGAWVEGDLSRARRINAELVEAYPRDLAGAKIGQYLAFNLGDGPAMLRLALPARRAAPEVAYAHGMAAFGFEQCHLLTQAEQAARQAIEIRRDEAWAQHALAHVMLTQGRTDEGAAFLSAMSDTWVGLNSFMLTHNWWHLCLFLIDQGEFGRVLDLYDTRVWGVVKSYSQDQINAVSLLARLELAGVDVGDRWSDLADHLRARVADHVQPFLDMQYLYGLARAGRPQADVLLANMAAHAAAASPDLVPCWREVAVPAARGLLAHARGRWSEVVEALGPVLGRLPRIGGSHAQRDLFELMYLDGLIRAGETVHAHHLLRLRVNAVPVGGWLRARLGALERELGIAA